MTTNILAHTGESTPPTWLAILILGTLLFILVALAVSAWRMMHDV